MSPILDVLQSIGAFFCICPRQSSTSSKSVATNVVSHEVRRSHPAPQDETWVQGISTLGDSTVQTILTANFEWSCVELNETPILQQDSMDKNIPKVRDESNCDDSDLEHFFENQGISKQEMLDMIGNTFVELFEGGAKGATNQQEEQLHKLVSLKARLAANV